LILLAALTRSQTEATCCSIRPRGRKPGGGHAGLSVFPDLRTFWWRVPRHHPCRTSIRRHLGLSARGNDDFPAVAGAAPRLDCPTDPVLDRQPSARRGDRLTIRACAA